MTTSGRDGRNGRAAEQARPKAERAGNPARFKLLYESADRRFCLFQDDEGHLTSVRSSKLA
jgi:hypothetical protein